MKRYIVDASVLITALTEPASAAAEEWACLADEAHLGKLEVWAPGILKYELANYFSKPAIIPAMAELFLKRCLEWPITNVQFGFRDLLRISSLAHEVGGSAYDASYHLLALENEAVFLTLDKRYFAAAKHKGAIRLLAA